MLAAVAVALTTLLLCIPAHAVILDCVDNGPMGDCNDPARNTTAPPDDPGWASVGARGGLGGVYLGNGWVISARHVNPGDMGIDGEPYPWVPGSTVEILHNGGPILAELHMWQIDPFPEHLPILPIRKTTPPVYTDDVVVIGRGRDRGPETTWTGIEGFETVIPNVRRWGTNLVGAVLTGGQPPEATTDVALPGSVSQAIVADFTQIDFPGPPDDPPDPLPTADEAQVATGDSGGALFIKSDQDVWELAGVIIAMGTFSGQPAETALYGNLSYAADLAFYRDQIIPVVRPECSDEIDNDGDGLIDFGPDPGNDPDCLDAAGLSEGIAVPALSNGGIAALAVLLLALPLLLHVAGVAPLARS